MKRLLMFVCVAFVAATLSADSMEEWLVGEWRPIPHWSFREIQVDDSHAYEPTSMQGAANPEARTVYGSDGTMVTPDGEPALWSIEESGDDWVVVVEKTTSVDVGVTIVREGDDAGLRLSLMPSGTLLYGKIERID